jgi:hypothetical protein
LIKIIENLLLGSESGVVMLLGMKGVVGVELLLLQAQSA